MPRSCLLPRLFARISREIEREREREDNAFGRVLWLLSGDRSEGNLLRGEFSVRSGAYFPLAGGGYSRGETREFRLLALE